MSNDNKDRFGRDMGEVIDILRDENVNDILETFGPGTKFYEYLGYYVLMVQPFIALLGFGGAIGWPASVLLVGGSYALFKLAGVGIMPMVTAVGAALMPFHFEPFYKDFLSLGSLSSSEENWMVFLGFVLLVPYLVSFLLYKLFVRQQTALQKAMEELKNGNPLSQFAQFSEFYRENEHLSKEEFDKKWNEKMLKELREKK